MKNNTKQNKTLRVAELFAGVGGFRIGLEGTPKKKLEGFKVVWSNQWEPSTKKQHAHEVYENRFGKKKEHSNEDIQKVVDEKFHEIPEHDLLVGGFPCQDYSVARTLSQAAGLEGKKGVLWWSIYKILLKSKEARGRQMPDYLMLENVDRLPKSPASRRGRDFAVMLSSLSDLGYIVEWKVINAADYGMPQRRKRIYIMAYKKNSPVYKEIKTIKNPEEWMLSKGVMAGAFQSKPVEDIREFKIEGTILEVSDKFNSKTPSTSPFSDIGMVIDRQVYTVKTKAVYSGKRIVLGDIIEKDEKKVPKEFFISKEDLEGWKKQKGAKKEPRQSKSGFTYMYSEGAMAFPDALDKPSRTIVTGEGGTTPSRFKHVIKTASGNYRRLTPIELEKLCMFPENHTEGQTDTRRAFFMGNALVVGVIEKLGRELLKHTNS